MGNGLIRLDEKSELRWPKSHLAGPNHFSLTRVRSHSTPSAMLAIWSSHGNMLLCEMIRVSLPPIGRKEWKKYIKIHTLQCLKILFFLFLLFWSLWNVFRGRAIVFNRNDNFMKKKVWPELKFACYPCGVSCANFPYCAAPDTLQSMLLYHPSLLPPLLQFLYFFFQKSSWVFLCDWCCQEMGGKQTMDSNFLTDL